MFFSGLSAVEQRELAERITRFLSLYTHISDSYIIVRRVLLSFNTHFVHLEPFITYSQ